MSITINGSGVDSVHIDGETIGSIWVDGAQVWSSAPKREVVKITRGVGGFLTPCAELVDALSARGLDYKTVEELPFDLDTSDVTNMHNMFYDCSSLTTVPEMDTSNVTNMYNMFYDCSSLTTVPEMDTSNVTNTGSMFDGCSSLTTVPEMDTSKATSLVFMFRGCSSLTAVGTIDGRSAKTRSGRQGGSFYQMFKDTPKLKSAKVLVSGTVSDADQAVTNSGLTTAVFVRG